MQSSQCPEKTAGFNPSVTLSVAVELTIQSSLRELRKAHTEVPLGEVLLYLTVFFLCEHTTLRNIFVGNLHQGTIARLPVGPGTSSRYISVV